MNAQAQTTTPPTATSTVSWRQVLAAVTAVVAAGQLVHAVTMHEFPPAGIVYGLAMALAAWSVSRSGGRLAIGFAGALNGFELFNMLFVYGGPAMLANPSAWQDFVVGALGGHDDGPQAGEARITMRDFAFQPAVVHVAVRREPRPDQARHHDRR